jgi:hypothetical protein
MAKDILEIPIGDKGDLIRFEPFKKRDGVVVASIRYFYVDKEGELRPGKQGLTLNREDMQPFSSKLKALYLKLPESEKAVKVKKTVKNRTDEDVDGGPEA